MEAGAWGLSSGLIYVPGRYADTAELIELARVVAAPRRHLRLAHPQRRGQAARVDRRGDRDRQGSGHPGAHLAPEGQRQGVLGDGRPGPRPDRRGARRPGRSSRPISIPTSPRAPSWRRWSCRTGRFRVTPTDFARLAADPSARPSAAARDRAGRSTSATAGPRSGSRGTRRGRNGPGSTWSRSPDARERRRWRSSSRSSGTAARRRSASA